VVDSFLSSFDASSSIPAALGTYPLCPNISPPLQVEEEDLDDKGNGDLKSGDNNSGANEMSVNVIIDDKNSEKNNNVNKISNKKTDGNIQIKRIGLTDISNIDIEKIKMNDMNEIATQLSGRKSKNFSVECQDLPHNQSLFTLLDQTRKNEISGGMEEEFFIGKVKK
jgi:hypothetical protein